MVSCYVHLNIVLSSGYFLCAVQLNLLLKKPIPFRFAPPFPLPKIKIRMIDIQCYTRDLDTTLYDPTPEHTINYTGSRTGFDSEKRSITVAPEDGIAVESGWMPRESSKRGWYLNIYVPISARLFVKKETRSFVLRASVWIGEKEDNPVGTSVDITLSHLRKEREMLV